MKLTLTDEDGVVIQAWDVENDLGDMSKPVARSIAMSEVADEIVQAQKEGKI